MAQPALIDELQTIRQPVARAASAGSAFDGLVGGLIGSQTGKPLACIMAKPGLLPSMPGHSPAATLRVAADAASSGAPAPDGTPPGKVSAPGPDAVPSGRVSAPTIAGILPPITLAAPGLPAGAAALRGAADLAAGTPRPALPRPAPPRPAPTAARPAGGKVCRPAGQPDDPASSPAILPMPAGLNPPLPPARPEPDAPAAEPAVASSPANGTAVAHGGGDRPDRPVSPAATPSIAPVALPTPSAEAPPSPASAPIIDAAGFNAAGGIAPLRDSAVRPANNLSQAATPHSTGIQAAHAIVALSATHGQQRVTVQLAPAELGRLQITVARGGKGADAVIITAERADTLALVQADSAALHAALDKAGLPAAERSLAFVLADPQASAHGSAGPAPAGSFVGGGGDPAPGQSDQSGGRRPAAPQSPFMTDVIDPADPVRFQIARGAVDITA